MKTYLITGGAGFIGSHLVEKLLKRGDKVVVVDNFDSFYDYKIKVNNILECVNFKVPFSCSNDSESDIRLLKQRTQADNFSLEFVDITDEVQLKRVFKEHFIEVVVHLAALAGVRPSIENPLKYQKVNIQGSLHLFELCKEFKINKFVCASSSSVYGNNEKTPFAETDIVDFAISPYAATKKSVEVLSHVYHSLYHLDIIQLRFFTVYGPRQRPDLAIHKFTKLISENQTIPFYGDGTTARDYTYIDDIIDGVMKSIQYVEDNTNVFEILNLGESEVITLSEMVSTLENALETKANLDKLPMQAGDVNHTFADIIKAKNMIGYNPQTNFQEGIAKFVAWFKAQENA